MQSEGGRGVPGDRASSGQRSRRPGGLRLASRAAGGCALALAVLVLGAALGSGVARAGLEDRVGRAEVQVRSAPQPFAAGRTLAEQGTLDRLRALGYRRVDGTPQEPGTYALNDRSLLVHRRAHRVGGRAVRARQIGVRLEKGRVVDGFFGDDRQVPLDRRGLWLEPQMLATSLTREEAPVIRVILDALPEAAWRPLVALEDHRFFSHAGLSARAVVRAVRANTRRGAAVEGGSTLTQQLIKNRHLSPRRGLDRKASEAARALVLEARHDKREILQAYLNTVSYGTRGGVGIRGLGAASQIWLGKSATELTLADGALLAAVVQAPSALDPSRHPERARARRDKALDRMLELGWADAAAVAKAKATPVRVVAACPDRPLATAHVRDAILRRAPGSVRRRVERGKGVQVETFLDPWLQARALDATAGALAKLRRTQRSSGRPQAAVAVADGRGGELRVYVGGDPTVGAGRATPGKGCVGAGAPDAFDRLARSERQTGSTLKPLALLHAFDACEARPVRPTTLINDGPLTVEGWSPRNHDGKDRGLVSATDALVDSRNLPFVRLSERCGREALAALHRRAGLVAPSPAPASIVLGSIEQRPMALLGATTVFVGAGKRAEPRLVRRYAWPGGARLGGEGRARRRVAPAAPTWLVHRALGEVVARGTGKAARIDGEDARGKTGTSTGGRDAWFVGTVGGQVGVVWVGLDRGALGASGGGVAAPLWSSVLGDAARAAAPIATSEPPRGVTTCRVNPETGLAPGVLGDSGAVEGPCLRRDRPRRNQPWRSDSADVLR